MTDKPLRECAHPGCHELTRNNRCDKHRKQTLFEAQRETSNQRGYNYQWGKVRAKFLSTHSLCDTCYQKGIITVAKIVHHIDEDQRNNDEDNLRSLCRDCHEQLHGRKRS